MIVKSLSRTFLTFGLCMMILSRAAVASSLETSVKVIELNPQKLEVSKAYIGHLEPLERVTIRSEASGTVERINFNKGQLVNKGQVLVHVSTERISLDVRRSKANYELAQINYVTQKALAEKNISLRKAELNLAQAKTDLTLAESEFVKEKKLLEKNFTTETNLDTKETTLETRKISYDKAQIELDQASIQTDQINLMTYKNTMETAKIALELDLLDLEKSKVKAPFSGIVKDKEVQIGGYVSAGESLLEIMDISKVLAVVNIPEKDVGFVKVGHPVKVTLDAYPETIFTGSVKTLGLEADTDSRSFPVEVIIDNSQGNLLPGMMTRAEMIAMSLSNQILIPSHAVVEKLKGKVVFVEENGKAVERNVSLGTETGEYVQVTRGLKSGERLIISGHQFLSHNQKINVIQSTKQFAMNPNQKRERNTKH